MPIDVAPNISGNINYSSDYDLAKQNQAAPKTIDESNEFNETTTNPEPVIKNNLENKIMGPYIWLWLVLFVLLIAIILFWGFRKLR